MNALVGWIRTGRSRVWTLQRLVLAAVILPYGAQTGVPSGAPMGVSAAAWICAALLALGLLTRLGALGATALWVAVLATGEGLALPLLGLALSLPLMVRGAGALSIDRMIVRQSDTLPLYQETTTDGLLVGRRVGEYGA